MKIKTLVLVENYDSPSVKEEYWDWTPEIKTEHKLYINPRVCALVQERDPVLLG